MVTDFASFWIDSLAQSGPKQLLMTGPGQRTGFLGM